MIDVCAHPVVARAGDINAYLPTHYRRARLAGPAYGPQPQAGDAYVAGSRPVDGSLPGSDPALFDAHVLDGPGAELAILAPLGRGLLGDVSLAAAIDAATNRWLAETWLESERNAHGRYRGSIRVTPRAPAEAVAEIEKWGEHPGFAQVLAPLEALTPYGQPEYFKVWEAAAAHDLPVAIHSEHSVGIAKAPTAMGNPGSYFEQYAQTPMYGLCHVNSLIAFGVFDRLPRLRVVLLDGGFDYFQPLVWRIDKDFRASASEVPLVARAPSEYMRERVRIVIGASDGREDAEAFRRFLEVNAELSSLLMYGSNYPSWDHLDAAQLAETLPPGDRDAIMDGTARELYGLAVPV